MPIYQADLLAIMNSAVVNDGGQWRLDFSGEVAGERGRFKSFLDLMNAITTSSRATVGDRSSQMKGFVNATPVRGHVRDLRSNGPLSGALRITQDGQVTEVWIEVDGTGNPLQIQIENDQAQVGDVVHLFVEQTSGTPLTPTFTDVVPGSITNIAPTFGTNGNNGITQLTFVCKTAGGNWILTAAAEIYWE
jgi:hypothetical protein